MYQFIEKLSLVSVLSCWKRIFKFRKTNFSRTEIKWTKFHLNFIFSEKSSQSQTWQLLEPESRKN